MMVKLGFWVASLIVVHGHDERLLDENGDYHHRGCATDAYNEAQLAANPSWADSFDAFETSWKETQSAIQAGRYDQSEQMSITIPIVFHIVSQNPDNVPDSAIAYQLERMQQDYSASNSDYTSGTPTEFQSLRSGDTQIRFFTQSTLRVVTSVSSFSSNDGIKYSSNGGSDVVDPDNNLNFWAGTLSGGLLGYAQFPGGPSSSDGVVQATGTLSPEIGSPPYNLGRTATHEVGHWLNLRHIWGDSSGCTNSALISDFVTDTPPSSSANFGCPSGTKRCSENAYSQDMFMNFMDYVDDSCMVMFTELQNARAQASIAEYRSGFNNVAESAKSFVNWLYFTRFESETAETADEKCVGEHELFYESDSASSVRIYGCLTRSNKVSVGHMTTVYLTEDGQCEEGHYRASQDLNEGNVDDGAVFVCYDKVESNDANVDTAVLEVSFVAGDVGVEGESFGGLRLRLAVETGTYLKVAGTDDDNNVGNPETTTTSSTTTSSTTSSSTSSSSSSSTSSTSAPVTPAPVITADTVKSAKSENGEEGAEDEDAVDGDGDQDGRAVMLIVVGVLIAVTALVSAAVWRCQSSGSRKDVKEMKKALADDGVRYGATVELRQLNRRV